MKRTRNLNIVALVLNVAIIALMATGIALFKGEFGVEQLKHFAVLSTFVTAFSSLLMIIPNIVNIKTNETHTPKLFFSLRYLSAVMSVVTLVAVLVFICPNEKDGFKNLFNVQDGWLFFYFIIPIISIFMFMFIETEKRERFGATFIPLAFVTVYALGIIIPTVVILVQKGGQAAAEFVPNYFFLFTKEMVEGWKASGRGDLGNLTAGLCILFGIINYLLTYVVALFLFAFNRVTYSIAVGVEYKDEKVEQKEEKQKQEIKENETIKEKIANFVKEEVSFKPGTKLDHVYHISYHDRKLKTWKVKSENAGRALKVFKNQKEAIEYAKGQVKLHGGSIRVHSVRGAIRKKGNWETFEK